MGILNLINAISDVKFYTIFKVNYILILKKSTLLEPHILKYLKMQINVPAQNGPFGLRNSDNQLTNGQEIRPHLNKINDLIIIV